MSPSQTNAAHTGIHEYRTAIDDAVRAANLLKDAAHRAAAAGAKLSPFLDSPLPAIEWTGAPPVADWQAAVDQVVAEVKASLRVTA